MNKLDIRFDQISAILNRNDSKSINTLFREIEMNHTIKSFTEYPDVKYSANMQKRMIQEAKRKNISKGRRELIDSMVNSINDFSVNEYLIEFEDIILQSLSILSNIKDEGHEFHLIHIEFDSNPNEQEWSIFSEKDQSNQIRNFTSNFKFDKIFGFTLTYKFESFCDSLQDIELNEEEYPQLFSEIFRLMAFKSVRAAFNSKRVANSIKEKFQTPHFKVEIAEHDCTSYEILTLNE